VLSENHTNDLSRVLECHCEAMHVTGNNDTRCVDISIGLFNVKHLYPADDNKAAGDKANLPCTA
jgi:hypothetical protein